MSKQLSAHTTTHITSAKGISALFSKDSKRKLDGHESLKGHVCSTDDQVVIHDLTFFNVHDEALSHFFFIGFMVNVCMCGC